MTIEGVVPYDTEPVAGWWREWLTNVHVVVESEGRRFVVSPRPSAAQLDPDDVAPCPTPEFVPLWAAELVNLPTGARVRIRGSAPGTRAPEDQDPDAWVLWADKVEVLSHRRIGNDWWPIDEADELLAEKGEATVPWKALVAGCWRWDREALNFARDIFNLPVPEGYQRFYRGQVDGAGGRPAPLGSDAADWTEDRKESIGEWWTDDVAYALS